MDELKSDSRRQEVVYCRKAFCLLAKEYLDVKYDIIAGMLGKQSCTVCAHLSTQPKDVLNDLEMDVKCAKQALEEDDMDKLLAIIYDIYCDAHYFMKDFNTSPEAMAAK